MLPLRNTSKDLLREDAGGNAMNVMNVMTLSHKKIADFLSLTIEEQRLQQWMAIHRIVSK
jgi:hypothetical protein